MTKRLSHVDTSLISYSVWQIRQRYSPNIFPALAVQSVSKCLKVFSGILVAELFSVYVFQRLSVCILIINQMFGLWQKNHIIYVYTLSLQYFLINFILTWNWRWPGTVGEKYPPKRKKNIKPTLNYSKLHWRSEIISDTLNSANPILHGASPPKSVLTTLLNHLVTLIYRASKPVMFGLLGCLVLP